MFAVSVDLKRNTVHTKHELNHIKPLFRKWNIIHFGNSALNTYGMCVKWTSKCRMAIQSP